MNKMYLLRLSAAFFACMTTSYAQLSKPDSVKTVAIFVTDRTTDGPSESLEVFEDMITARLSSDSFAVISRELVTSAVESLTDNSKTNDLDMLLEEQSSALRLSQNLGADYLLFASLVSYNNEKRVINAYGSEITNWNYILRASYRIIDGNTGRSIAADITTVDHPVQQTKFASTTSSDIKDKLLDKASAELAAKLTAKAEAGKIRAPDPKSSQVSFQIAVGISDINFPEVIFDEKGNPTITANRGTVQALAVTVELDGFAIGTTGIGEVLSTFKARPGLHRIKLTRDDLVPWERSINIYDGLQLNVSMSLNEAGLKRWRENTQIFNDMKADAALNAAEVERVKGVAQMLRQSGFMINIKSDTKEDIKVDTDEALQIQQNKSMFGN